MSISYSGFILKFCLTILTVSFLACNFPCRESPVNPTFVGYKIADIDTFILRIYQADDNFQHLLDTVLVHNKQASIFTSFSDTTVVYINDSDPQKWISTDHDFELYLPAINKSYRITNIASDNNKGGKNCLNPITSLKLDGQFMIPSLSTSLQFYLSGYRVYLHK